MPAETTDTTTAGPVEKRIYVGGLHESVTESHVHDLFCKFGQVTKVAIAKDTEDRCRGFGHMTLITTPTQWTSCLSNYNGAKWKGGKLRLEEAKPGFVERKTAEAELLQAKEEKKRKRGLRWNDSDGFFAKDMTLVTDNNMNGRKGWKRCRYGRAIAVMKLTKQDGTRFVFDPSHYKNNLTKLYGMGAPMKPASSLPMLYESPTSQENMQSTKSLETGKDTRNSPPSLKTQPEEKRLAAMERRQEEQEARRAIVSQALTTIDSKNHTKFKDSDEEEENAQAERGRKEANDAEEAISDFKISEFDKETRDGAKWLFDSDSDHEIDHEIMINPVLEGTKGRERLALQSRFKGDERFKLDDAFIDDNEEGETAEGEAGAVDETAAELLAEKNRSMDLLRAMFGDETMKTKPKQGSGWKSEERYDPEAHDAADYLVTSSEKKQSSVEAVIETSHLPQSMAPEMSSARHFEVNVNMKPLFGGEQDVPFRLFSGADDEPVTDEEESAKIDAKNENEEMPNLVTKNDEAHVGLGLMLFFHMDEPDLMKRSCFAYDPNGIFQYQEKDRDAYENRWREQRSRIGQSLKRRQKEADGKQIEQTTRDLK